MMKKLETPTSARNIKATNAHNIKSFNCKILPEQNRILESIISAKQNIINESASLICTIHKLSLQCLTKLGSIEKDFINQSILGNKIEKNSFDYSMLDLLKARDYLKNAFESTYNSYKYVDHPLILKLNPANPEMKRINTEKKLSTFSNSNPSKPIKIIDNLTERRATVSKKPKVNELLNCTMEINYDKNKFIGYTPRCPGTPSFNESMKDLPKNFQKKANFAKLKPKQSFNMKIKVSKSDKALKVQTERNQSTNKSQNNSSLQLKNSRQNAHG